MRRYKLHLTATLLGCAALLGDVSADGHAKLESPYGEGDMAGASNLMTAAKAMEAIALMKTGSVMSIGRTYEPGMPLFGARVFAVRGTGGLAGGPLGSVRLAPSLTASPILELVARTTCFTEVYRKVKL